ncbi:MAG: hypothetical protein JWO44_1223 [Bacteroidetes bacterium]|nr:hypothetical protein [Bacteroidota bacterium]
MHDRHPDVPLTEKGTLSPVCGRNFTKKTKAMKRAELYKLLPIEDKIELLMRKGEFVMSYEALDYETWLYALDGQLVEIIYSIVFNRIEDIRVMEDNKRIDIYLENIDITELIAFDEEDYF